MNQQRALLVALLNAGIAAVSGRERVRKSMLNQQDACQFHLIAVGKCAVAMAMGAHDVCASQIISSLIITKDEPLDEAFYLKSNVEYLVSSHPVPDARSLKAGQALLRYIGTTPPDAKLVFLISGGTSSLVEVLREGVSLDDLISTNTWLLANDINIHKINAVRKRLSLIKGGGILSYIGERVCEVKLISDVPGDVISSIGSGWFYPTTNDDVDFSFFPSRLLNIVKVYSPAGALLQGTSISSEVIASNHDARHAVVDVTEVLGWQIYWQEDKYINGDVGAVAEELAEQILSGPPGVYLWGGETTVTLPVSPGRGGRNQHLALLVARKIQKHDNITFLAAGTDGSDGPGQDAGAIVDGRTIQRGIDCGMDVDIYLRHFDAGTYLSRVGSLIRTGPTGTNVMDLILAVKA